MQEKCLREYCSSWGVCMRELKFRAWDKSVEHMIYSDSVEDDYYWQIGETGVYVEWYDPAIARLFPDGVVESSGWTEAHCVIMQYTGLKDTNGKEIYEGDIVKHWSGIGEVIFDHGIAGFNVKGYYDQSADYPTIAFAEGIFEVIGNIFENPGLAEDTT